jgi:uncharacterized protein
MLSTPQINEIFHKCMSGESNGELTAQNVSLYHSAPYWIFCEKFVSADRKDPRSPYRELLQERGQEHEKRFIQESFPENKAIDYTDAQDGFLMLLKAMARGADVICGMPLFFLPENMQGRIDVLEKRLDHASIFGDYHYAVKEIKLSKKIRREHIIQAAFYTYLIGKIQEYLPGKFFIINRDYEETAYCSSNYAEELAKAVTGTQAILDGVELPTPTYNGCEWPWQRYCNHQALKTQDVSLVGHVGIKTKATLAQHGFTKLWDVSSAKVEDLQKIPRIGATNAQRLIVNAKAIKKGKPIPLDISLLNFPKRSAEIFLDLEGTDQPGQEDELTQVDYLIGILVRRGGKEEYTPFMARRPCDEATMFREFMGFMSIQEDYVIYHWHNYERWHIQQLAERYGMTAETERILFPYMIDLYKIATGAFAFPTYSNGLKEIAAFLGFRWRNQEINALDAIAYYLKYQENPEAFEENMCAIVGYNEDDCIATRVIKDWLKEQCYQ